MEENSSPQELYNRFRPLLLLAIVTLGIGTIFYHYVEGFSWIDGLYFSVVTLATVGYGDLAPHTDIGKIFTIFYILTGVGIIATFANMLFQRRVERLKHHEQKHRSKD